MKMDLSIELGNDAMRSTADIGWALAKTATRISEVVDDDADGNARPASGTILDLNGNTVGRWQITEAAE
jgi:hypothetical protein